MIEKAPDFEPMVKSTQAPTINVRLRRGNLTPENSAPQKATTPWSAWFEKVRQRLNGDSGTTSNRPTEGLYIGRHYFDTTLGRPIWYDGTNWVDATGTTV